MPYYRVLFLLGLALLGACAQQPQRNVELDAESECPQRLQVGQGMTLSLPSNPSTGYRWLVQNPASNILRSLGPGYTAPRKRPASSAAPVFPPGALRPRPLVKATWCWFTNSPGPRRYARCRPSTALCE